MDASTQETVPESLAPSGALDGKLVQGIAWTGGVKWSTQIVAWAATLFVARVLSPDDYGLVGMATVYLGLVTMLSEFGIGTTIITLRDLTTREIAQLNGFSILLGLGGFALSCLAAAPIGAFFRSARLPLVVVAMSTTFIISSFQSVPSALLQRDLRFKLISLIDGTKTMVLALATVLFALGGLRYWTLVLGAILSALISTTLTLCIRRHAFAMPQFKTLSCSLRFSWHVLISRLSWYAYSNSDFVVSGRVLGQLALGAYSVAWNLANVPVEKITGVLNGVTPALFSAVQKEKAELRRYLLNLTEAIALLTLPLSIGLGLVTSDFVTVLLGQKWSIAVTPLRFLAFYVTVRSITPLLPIVLNVVGESRFNMWNSIGMAIVLPAGFLFGSRWGNAGIAAAWMIAYPVAAIPMYWRAFRKIELPWGVYLNVLGPSALGSLFMAATVLILQRTGLSTSRPEVRLIATIIAGAVAYILVAGGLNFRRRKNLARILRVLRTA
ncbi:MAG TPA: lipopolysaccharide biosynthesis protein [Terriglobales bacterium]|jgi:PST family polysaccharide transporter